MRLNTITITLTVFLASIPFYGFSQSKRITDFFQSFDEIAIKTFQDTLELRYRGLHFGDHPITTYEKIDKYYVVRKEGKKM